MQLSTSYLLCWTLQLGRQQITELTVADVFKVEFLLCFLSTILVAFLRLNISYMIFFLLLIVLFGHPIFLKFFSSLYLS